MSDPDPDSGVPAKPFDPRRDVRLHPYLDARNVLLDAPENDAANLIRSAFARARLVLHGANGATSAATIDRVCRSVLEREALSSTAYHPEVAYPHPKDSERSLLGANQLVLIRARGPVDFRDPYGHRPRLALILLNPVVSMQFLWEARLSYLIQKRQLVPRLLNAVSPAEICNVFAKP
jgi:mannitol/fructose-specific phosphotransferase system IIA component (Ntr-type)